MSEKTEVQLDLDAVERAAKAAMADAPGARSTEFLVKTNEECMAWMQSFYQSNSIPTIDRHCTWAWQEQERRQAPLVLELIKLLRAARALASSRLVEVREDSVAVALVGAFKPEHHDELKAFHDAIRRTRAPNTLVLCVTEPLNFEVIDEEQMRNFGWVRAPGGDA